MKCLDGKDGCHGPQWPELWHTCVVCSLIGRKKEITRLEKLTQDLRSELAVAKATNHLQEAKR